MPEITLFDDVPLHYELAGWDRDADVVVFLNGMTQSTQHWSSHARSFSEHLRVVTYDARGQGGRPTGDVELTLEQHADDLAELLDALDVERAHIAGFSHGARVALAFANAHAHKLDQLVLVSATAAPTGLARTIVRSWREVLERGGLEAMAWSSLPTILGTRYLEQNERIIPGIIKASTQRNSKEGVAKLLDAMIAYPDLGELAQGVRAPTLVMAADADLLVTPSGAQKLAELCSGRFELVEDCGHTIPIERPEEFRSAVLDFLL
jgi:pimeloyl-ACP methyl ester carboxylesterase